MSRLLLDRQYVKVTTEGANLQGFSQYFDLTKYIKKLINSSGGYENIYTTNGTLGSDRTVTRDGNAFYVDDPSVGGGSPYLSVTDDFEFSPGVHIAGASLGYSPGSLLYSMGVSDRGSGSWIAQMTYNNFGTSLSAGSGVNASGVYSWIQSAYDGSGELATIKLDGSYDYTQICKLANEDLIRTLNQGGSYELGYFPNSGGAAQYGALSSRLYLGNSAFSLYVYDNAFTPTESNSIYIDGTQILLEGANVSSGDNGYVGVNSSTSKVTISSSASDIALVATTGDLTIDGTPGFTGTGAYTNFTITKGIITAAS